MQTTFQATVTEHHAGLLPVSSSMSLGASGSPSLYLSIRLQEGLPTKQDKPVLNLTILTIFLAHSPIQLFA